VECSSGTYVRSLIADLGDAYCLELRRTRIGPFEVVDAGEDVIGLDHALAFMPQVTLAGEDATRAAHGARIPLPAGVESVIRVLDADGLICLAEPRDEVDGGPPVLKPIVGFRG
jgi:tRNA pseudouridine55 synthase